MPLTQVQRHELEADVIRRVYGKEKKVKSNLVAGSRPVLKKKDRVELALAQDS